MVTYEDKFYNFLKQKADKIHDLTWETHTGKHKNSDAYAEAKTQEILMGEIMREYVKFNGEPKEIQPIEIQDYIDPMSTFDMKHYLYMQTYGEWSDNFKKRMELDHVIITNPSWKQLIDVKLADFWIKKHLLTSEYENVVLRGKP